MTTERAGLREALRIAENMDRDAADHPLRLVEVSQALFRDTIIEPLRAALLAAPVAVDVERTRDILYETLMEHGVWDIRLRGGHALDASKHAAALADLLSERLAARLPEPEGADHDR